MEQLSHNALLSKNKLGKGIEYALKGSTLLFLIWRSPLNGAQHVLALMPLALMVSSQKLQYVSMIWAKIAQPSLKSYQ